MESLQLIRPPGTLQLAFFLGIFGKSFSSLDQLKEAPRTIDSSPTSSVL
jgi:hypothetical protein